MTNEHPITQHRRRRGQTMRQLAGELTVSKSTISRLESGRQYPSFELLRRLEAKGISTTEIVRWTQSQQVEQRHSDDDANRASDECQPAMVETVSGEAA